MTMHVSLLTPSNAQQYRTLMLEAYELAADAFTTTAAERETEPEAFWIKRIGDAKGLGAAFGAFDGDALVGTVALEFSAKPKIQHRALVIGMYVSPSARGKGAARKLLEAALTYVRLRIEIKMLVLTVTEGNEPAIKLYRSVGFQSFGVEPMAILTESGFKGKVHMWQAMPSGAAAA